MRRTVNTIIKDTIHIFASFGKIMRILLMEPRNHERWYNMYVTLDLRPVKYKWN